MLRNEGMHGHPVGGDSPKPLCRNFGQLAKLTGDWVDHPEPTYQGMYSQVNIAHLLLHPSYTCVQCTNEGVCEQDTEGLLLAKQVLAGFTMSDRYCMYLHVAHRIPCSVSNTGEACQEDPERCWCFATPSPEQYASSDGQAPLCRRSTVQHGARTSTALTGIRWKTRSQR